MIRVGIVGGGISGLAAAHYLLAIKDVSVTLFEAAPHLGGRADVTVDGEHCPRFFLSDYEYLFDILKDVPLGNGSVLDAFEPARRFSKMPSGRWIEIDHLYASHARTVARRDKVALAVANQRSLLIAKRSSECRNSFGAAANFSPRGLRRTALSLKQSRTGYVLPGATDTCLIEPWTALLRKRGADIRTDARIRRVAVDDDIVRLTIDTTTYAFDRVIVTAFAPDAYRLIDDSGAVRRLDWRVHTHCKCLTIDLDPREPILAEPDVRVYSRVGMTTVVQPKAGRAVVATTTLQSTDDGYVLACVREDLNLQYAPARVVARENRLPSEAVFIGDYVDPRSLSHALEPTRFPDPPRVLFAGSYTANSYPVDSAEGACRSAFNAVDRIRHETNLTLRQPRSTPHLAPVLPEQREPYRAIEPHPNAAANVQMSRRLWLGAVSASRLTARPLARITFVDRSQRQWPLGEPAVYVATHRSIFDVIAGLMTFDHLGVQPHLIVAQKYFKGIAGRALAAIGAIPALRGSDATIAAAIGAVRSGSSVAFMVEGRITNRTTAETAAFGRGAFEVCLATGAPLVPLVSAGVDAIWSSHRPWPLVAHPRKPVGAAIGEPLYAEGRTVTDLSTALRTAFAELQKFADDAIG